MVHCGIIAAQAAAACLTLSARTAENNGMFDGEKR